MHYLGCRWYFVTLCCDRRRRVFVDPAFTELTTITLRERSSRSGFGAYAYCFMPDHLHILVEGLNPLSDLLGFIADFKQRTTSQFHREFPGRSLWQKKFYDHILRPKDSADAVAAYIWMNPVRKGLCLQPEDYPHSGSFSLEWKKATRSSPSCWTPPWKAKQS